MNTLESIRKKEKELKEKKRQIIKKEYEKLGRLFYKKSNAKSFKTATNMLENIPMFSDKQTTQNSLNEEDLKTLKTFANNLTWNENGHYWRTEEIKELTQFLAKFRDNQ